MIQEQDFELITVNLLLDKVRTLRAQGFRLVQIGATRLPDQVELTYSFDRNAVLKNLRLTLPGKDTHLPSISSIYGCVILYENELHDLFNIQVDGMAVDFHGNLYKTAIKFPFGTVKAPVAKAAPTAKPEAKAVPAPAPAPAH